MLVLRHYERICKIEHGIDPDARAPVNHPVSAMGSGEDAQARNHDTR